MNPETPPPHTHHPSPWRGRVTRCAGVRPMTDTWTSVHCIGHGCVCLRCGSSPWVTVVGVAGWPACLNVCTQPSIGLPGHQWCCGLCDISFIIVCMACRATQIMCAHVASALTAASWPVAVVTRLCACGTLPAAHARAPCRCVGGRPHACVTYVGQWWSCQWP